MDGKLNIDDLITHKLSLDEINKGFDLMKSGESIRSVVLY
jgi:S-(hydroxymethyl)glutathione dehydrogenase/alcohol dehydrogenase